MRLKSKTYVPTSEKPDHLDLLQEFKQEHSSFFLGTVRNVFERKQGSLVYRVVLWRKHIYEDGFPGPRIAHMTVTREEIAAMNSLSKFDLILK